jgi:hypothetical protein
LWLKTGLFLYLLFIRILLRILREKLMVAKRLAAKTSFFLTTAATIISILFICVLFIWLLKRSHLEFGVLHALNIINIGQAFAFPVFGAKLEFLPLFSLIGIELSCEALCDSVGML